jgi:ketol-acid reductoisomerase
VGGRLTSAGIRAAREDGFQVDSISRVVPDADLVIVALPDEVHAQVWRDEIAPHIHAGQTVGFMHGLSVHFGLVTVPHGVGCVLVAPKGPGTTLREQFSQGRGIPALLAVHQEVEQPSGPAGSESREGTMGAEPTPSARELALAWAAGIGCGRAGVVVTTFGHEAETDLFGEQAVLCGGMLGLAQAAYETLVEAGYPPLLAYTECVHEIKQVADLLDARGPSGMRAAISNTAEYGALTAAPFLADQHVRARMKELLRQIQSGAFARMIAEDAANGGRWLAEQRRLADAHSMEQVGRAVRELMPWLQKGPIS